MIGSCARVMGWRGKVPQREGDCCHQEKVKVLGIQMQEMALGVVLCYF